MSDPSTRDRALRLLAYWERVDEGPMLQQVRLMNALTAERQAALTEACKRVRRVMEAGASRNQILAAIMGENILGKGGQEP